jgi:phosphoglycolate phosphatase
MAIRGILFDKDGTLVDFFETWIPAYRAASDMASAVAGDCTLGDRLLRLGGYDPVTGALDPDSILASGTTLEICDLWAAESGVPDRRKLSRKLHQEMEEHVIARPVPVAHGIADLFRRLADRGLVLGMATMDGEAVARATANAFDLSGFLSFISGYDSGYGSKPAPGMVRAFCAVAGLSPADIVVVGDTDRDINMARAAGAGLAVAVLTGATPREGLAPIADRVIASVFDIESVLD